MELSKSQQQRRRREQLKAQGLVYVQGWVNQVQAAAIQAIMSDQMVNYDPAHEENFTPADNFQSTPTGQKKLHFKKKNDHNGGWTVWLDNAEIGTVYKHNVEEESQIITVWVAYRHGGRSTRHVTRQHAAEALLSEYRGFP